MIIEVTSDGWLTWPKGRVRCVLGRSGVTSEKTEGDGATPAGVFALRRVFYRADHLAAPLTDLPISPLNPDDGWCDDPESEDYNCWVTKPLAAGHEARGVDEVGDHLDLPPRPEGRPGLVREEPAHRRHRRAAVREGLAPGHRRPPRAAPPSHPPHTAPAP